MTKFLKEFLKKHAKGNRKPTHLKEDHIWKSGVVPVPKLRQYNKIAELGLPKRIPTRIKNKDEFKLESVCRGRK